MHRLFFTLLVGMFCWGQTFPQSVQIYPKSILLLGPDSSQQFIVSGLFEGGLEKDITHLVEFSSDDSSIIRMDKTGRIHALQNGKTILKAKMGKTVVQAEVNVQGIEQQPEFQFAKNIGTILTKNGCNGSGCHGGVKGRGGLKLSAGSLYPEDDYEWIVKGGAYQVLTSEVKGDRIPRIDLKQPEKSLILQKATGSIPHGGGRRFKTDSPDYQMILEWVKSGAPYGAAVKKENKVVSLEVFPSTIALEAGGQQRVIVTAHFSDSRKEDFTNQALFASNNKDVATVDDSGLIHAQQLGETAILIRAAGQAISTTVGVIGSPVRNYPKVQSANFIDDHVFEKLRRFRIVPSELSSDSEFLRRICLDLTGTLPPPHRVLEFIQSKDPKKREKLIDLLIGSPEFVDYWTYRFDDVFRVSVNANALPKWSQMYAEWIRDNIETNKPYDQVARERLSAQGYTATSRHFLPYNVIAPVQEIVSEEVRVFFGRRLDCAQCHNHPYETWSQDQFWGMAAFFGRMFKMGDNGVADDYIVFDHPPTQKMGSGDVNADLKVLHPRTKVELKPTLLDGKVVEPVNEKNPRIDLAEWMVNHPYFAEAIVNRMWSHFFGRGIVDPVDDFRSTNPPTHPELLAELAERFRRDHHDLRKLIRLIVTSRTYQLSGATKPENANDRTNYSHAFPRALDAEVLLDAISEVTGVPEIFTIGIPDGKSAPKYSPIGLRAINIRQPETYYSRFLDLYGRPSRLTIPERSGKANLSQALNMLAGPVYNEKVSSEKSRLSRLLQSGKKDTEIIEEFYLAAFSRRPEQKEMSALLELIGQRLDRSEAFRDFVWAVLCSREFAENH